MCQLGTQEVGLVGMEKISNFRENDTIKEKLESEGISYGRGSPLTRDTLWYRR